MSFPRYESSKESGVQWLGRVPAHWEIRRIRRLFEIRKRISGADGYTVLSITQQGIKPKDTESGDGQLSADYSKYQFVEVGDFAMNHMDLLTGYVDISPIFGVTSPDYRVFGLRDSAKCFDRYFLYLLQAGYRNKIFYAFGQGSSQLGRWRFPSEEFNSFEFPLPPIEEQRNISVLLDRETSKIDALIAEQRRLIELLKEKRHAIISQAVTKGLNPDASRKHSGIEWLGEVPAHWKLVRVKSIVRSLEQGWSPQCEGYPVESADEWGVLKVGCVNGGKFNPLENKALPIDLQPIPALGLTSGDILISRANTRELVGSAAVVDKEHPNLMLCDKLYRLKSDTSLSIPRFIVFYLAADGARSRIELAATGASSSMLNIGQSVILNLEIALPPLEEQAEIVNFIVEQTTKLDVLTTEAQTGTALLQERRAALISAAVTGKIDVGGLQATAREKEAAA